MEFSCWRPSLGVSMDRRVDPDLGPETGLSHSLTVTDKPLSRPIGNHTNFFGSGLYHWILFLLIIKTSFRTLNPSQTTVTDDQRLGTQKSSRPPRWRFYRQWILELMMAVSPWTSGEIHLERWLHRTRRSVVPLVQGSCSQDFSGRSKEN